MLRARSEIPVVIENDANALAYGELHRGVGVNSLVAVHLENGLGAGIITNGRLHGDSISGGGDRLPPHGAIVVGKVVPAPGRS